jgi:hypothetical protein
LSSTTLTSNKTHAIAVAIVAQKNKADFKWAVLLGYMSKASSQNLNTWIFMSKFKYMDQI